MNNSHTNIKHKDEIKLRVLNAKAKLPRNYTTFFVHFFPEFDNDEGKKKLRSVLNMQQVDEQVTEKLERLIQLIAI